MAQRVMPLAAKTSNLTSSPGRCKVEGKNRQLQVVLWLPRAQSGRHAHSPTSVHTDINAMKKLFKHAVSLFMSFNNCRYWCQEATYVLTGAGYSLFSVASSPAMLCVVLGAGSLVTKALIRDPGERQHVRNVPVPWIHRQIHLLKPIN